MKMTRSESGKLGAIALNSNPEKKREAIRKAAATLRAKNPKHYIEMGKLKAAKQKQTILEVDSHAY